MKEKSTERSCLFLRVLKNKILPGNKMFQLPFFPWQLNHKDNCHCGNGFEALFYLKLRTLFYLRLPALFYVQNLDCRALLIFSDYWFTSLPSPESDYCWCFIFFQSSIPFITLSTLIQVYKKIQVFFSFSSKFSPCFLCCCERASLVAIS